MRVIAGRLRGRRLEVPRSPGVRPTYDRVRESVFAIIEPELSGASILDLFAGSGSLAIESLSRGAARATLVERDPAVARVARANVESLDLERECVLVRADALRALDRPLRGAPFDVVFVDPPYGSGLQGEVMGLLGGWSELADIATVVLERAAGRGLESAYGRLGLDRTERYGTTEIDFYHTRRAPAGGGAPKEGQ